MTKVNKQAKHMSQTASRSNARNGKAKIVALAITGVLAIGGVGAVCVAGLGKSPGQAPVAAQTAMAQKPGTKATTRGTTQRATTKPSRQTTKPAQQQTSKPAQQTTKPTQQQQTTKPAPQPAPQQQSQTPAPSSDSQNSGSSNNGLEVKVSREGAIAMACDHVGAGGQAKGEAQNVTANGPITGGGTIYYVVELDLGDVHYTVTVDAVDGNVINADQVHAGTRTLLDENGDPQEGTEQPVDA